MLRLLVCLLIVGLTTLYTGSGISPDAIVIITLDTTRVDRLSVYGFMGSSTPRLERLAADAVVFDRASTVAPLTLPAHASLFTGRLPPVHGVRDNASPPLDAAATTLAEVLRARGFRTGAFVASVVVGRDRGLAQGFEVYDSVERRGWPGAMPPQRRADDVVSAAIDWVDGVGRTQFFLWVHLYDPHRPYDPPEPFRSSFADPYVGEIAFADSQVGRLLDALDRRGRLARTVVVVAADHGESLGDHGEEDHGIFLYQSVLRVPLLIRAPSIAARRSDAVVRLIDVMPTVLDLAGAAAPPGDGASLVRVMRGEALRVELDAYAESLYPQRFGWSPLRSLYDGRYKYIEAPRPELYDLDRDPFEERNLHGERASLARALARRLHAVAGPDADGQAITDPPADPELPSRLNALGYVAAPILSAPATLRPLADPKDCIHLHRTRPGVVMPGPSPPESACR